MSCADSDDDYAASMMSTSEVSGQSSENPSRKRKSTRGNLFWAWSFRLTVKADLGNGATAEENISVPAQGISGRYVSLAW